MRGLSRRGITLLGKYCWNKDGFLRTRERFPWTVPAGHAVLLLIPGLVMAALNRLRDRRISLRTGAWLFASLAIWAALLRAPLYGASSLLLAVGLGRLIADWIAARGLRLRRLRFVATALLGLLGVVAALSSGWQAVREYARSPDCRVPPRAPGTSC